MEVWLNGSWTPRDAAKVSAFDAGFQHGVGLFETMHARNGRVFRLHAHLERMAASAKSLRLSESLRVAPLGEAVEATVARNGLRDARVRLTITGGDLNLLQQGADRTRHAPTLLIVAQPPTKYPDALFANGVRVTIADARSNPLDPSAGHKTLWYWPRLAALQQAGANGATEALWFSVTNHLASGCVSNVFLVKDGVVRTPVARGEEVEGGLPAPVLPGVTRAAIFELCTEAGARIDRCMLTYDDLRGADEVFLTNSSWGVMPVVQVERVTIGSGAVGPVATSLRAALEERVERETSTPA